MAKALTIDGRPAGLLVQESQRGTVRYLTVQVCTYPANGDSGVRGLTGGVYDCLGYRTYADDKAGGVYSIGARELVYFERFAFDAHDVVQAAKLLTSVRRAVDRMDAVEGSARTVGQAVNRLARALNVSRVTIYDRETDRKTGDGYQHIRQLGDVPAYVDHAIARWFPRTATDAA